MIENWKPASNWIKLIVMLIAEKDKFIIIKLTMNESNSQMFFQRLSPLFNDFVHLEITHFHSSSWYRFSEITSKKFKLNCTPFGKFMRRNIEEKFQSVKYNA